MKFTMLILLLSSPAWAQAPLKGLHVMPLKKNIDTSKFKAEGATIHKVETKRPGVEIPFTKEKRDAWLAKAKLTLPTSDWDDFGKDELVIRSLIYTPDRLVKAYPKLEAAELLELQKIALEESKTGKK